MCGRGNRVTVFFNLDAAAVMSSTIVVEMNFATRAWMEASLVRLPDQDVGFLLD